MSRWVVHAESSFSAIHALRSYLGRPEDAHEHSWRIAIRVGRDELTDEGFAVDFHAVRALLAHQAEALDGTDLSQHPALASSTPSAERVAELLAAILGPQVEQLGGTLLTVSVWEGPENRVDLNL